MELDGVMSDSQDWLIRALAWAGVETPPQSPKTINARVSCQDQDMTNPPDGKRSLSSTHPPGR